METASIDKSYIVTVVKLNKVCINNAGKITMDKKKKKALQ